MNINWITRSTNWAFDNLCNHIINKMPNHKHEKDKKQGDIDFVCSPQFFKCRKASKRTVLHIDSNRWYDQIIKESK